MRANRGRVVFSVDFGDADKYVLAGAPADFGGDGDLDAAVC